MEPADYSEGHEEPGYEFWLVLACKSFEGPEYLDETLVDYSEGLGSLMKDEKKLSCVSLNYVRSFESCLMNGVTVDCSVCLGVEPWPLDPS